MAALAFYSNLLTPFSSKRVVSLDELSSRERPGARCYEAIQVCEPPGLVYTSLDPKSGVGVSVYQLEYKKTGRYIMDYYKLRNQLTFESKKAPPGTCVVTFGLGHDYLNLAEMQRVETAKGASGFKKRRCVTMEPNPESFVTELAMVDATHALVGTHRTEVTFRRQVDARKARIALNGTKNASTLWSRVFRGVLYHTQALCEAGKPHRGPF